MEPGCPTTAETWNQKSTERACTPKGNYHCMQTQDDNEVIELCKNPIWIEAGKCPIYNKAGMLDSTSCVSRPPNRCPSDAYKSNTVYKYPTCFPENRLSSTSTRGITHAVPQQNRTSVHTTSTDHGGAGPELVALILLIIPIAVVTVIVFLHRRGYIKRWRQNINRRQHRENVTEDAALPSPSDTCHMTNGENIEDDRSESEALMHTDDTTSLSIEGTRTNIIHQSPGGETQSSDITKQSLSTPKGSNTKVINRPTGGENHSLGTRKERRIRVITAKVSSIERMAESLSSGNVVVITGLLGSGKTSLAYETVVSVCQNISTKANVRHIKDIKELEEIPTNEETFLIIDECIKSWFNRNIIDTLLKHVENVVKNGQGKTKALICVPATVSKNVQTFLKGSSLPHKIYDLDGDVHTEEDWRAIFDSHMQSRIDWIRDKKYSEGDIHKYREAYIKCTCSQIGKMTVPSLLFENVLYVKNVYKFFKNPYDVMFQRITDLSTSSWIWKSNVHVRHFVALVILMLYNGKTNIEGISKDMLTEICKHFKIENFALPHDLQQEEIEEHGDSFSIRCRETVLVTFDVFWKKRKDVIIKYCDDELFLERVSLDGVAGDDLLAINNRFQAMISAGTPYVEQHRLLGALRSQCSTLNEETSF